MAKVFDEKWGGDRFGTPGGVVTWSIVPPGIGKIPGPFSVSSPQKTVGKGAFKEFDIEFNLRKAFEQWSSIADIEFVQVRDDGTRIGKGDVGDIRIALGKGADTQGRGWHPVEGDIGGDVLLVFSPSASVSTVLYLALHEIGHAIGLNHSEKDRAVMSVGYSTERLTGDDIFGARTLYGEQDRKRHILELEPGEDLEIVHSPEKLWVLGGEGSNRVTGAGASEVIKGGDGNDRLDGGGGSDRVMGGRGNDRLVGGAGDDLLQGQRGRDKLKSGGGEDTLRFKRGDGEDVVLDWKNGKDVIHIQKGAKGFRQLDIHEKGRHVLVEYGKRGDVIKLKKTDADELDASDFLFG